MENQLDYTALGERIRKARKANSVTQEQLGEICSLSAAHIGHIERGTRIPSLETLFKISTALHISLDALVFGSVDLQETMFVNIASMLKGKNKKQVDAFYNTVRILAEKIDEL